MNHMGSGAAEFVPMFPLVNLVSCELWAGGHWVLAVLTEVEFLPLEPSIHSLGNVWTVTEGHSRELV